MTQVAMIVLSRYPSDPRVRREAEALVRAGISVDVICLRGPGELPVETTHGVTAHRVLLASEKGGLGKYLWLTVKFMVVAFVALCRLSLRKRYDLLQVHNMPDYLVFGTVLHKMRGTPVVLDLHDLTVELYESRWMEGKLRLLLPLVRVAERISCAFANHLITASAGFRDRLVQRGSSPEMVTLVLNSADDRLFRPPKRDYRLSTNGLRIVYHGTVKERFGLHVAVEAMALVLRERPAAILAIYGNYDRHYRENLENRIANLGLSGAIVLHDYRPVEDIVEILTDSHIGLVPYLSDPFMDIALSTKSFEYVAMGLPVVAARLPSSTSLFGEDCFSYFSPGDPRDMADKIVSLSQDPVRQRAQAESALKAYEKIAWPIMEKRYVDLIQNTIEESKRR